MKNDRSILTSLGLAVRANKITLGTELTCDGIKQGKVRLVLLSEQASANTLKKVTRSCFNSCVALYIINTDSETLAHSVGKNKPIMTIGVTDENLSIPIINAINRSHDSARLLQASSESEV